MNSSDIVITLLGESGKKQWTRSEILDILSDELRIDKKDAANKFNNIITRHDYFEKIGDIYQFSKNGNNKKSALQNLKKKDKDFNNTVETFIKNYYWDELIKCLITDKEYIEIDHQKLCNGFPYFIELLEKEPDIAIMKFNDALKDISVPSVVSKWPYVSIYNTGEVLQIENIKTEHIGKFIEVEGRVSMQNMPKSEIIMAAFKCQRCGEVITINQGNGKYIEPYQCYNCERKGPFTLLEKPESQFIDGQEIFIESLHGGQVSIEAHLSNSQCRPPWERDAKIVRICGVVRAWHETDASGKSTRFNRTIDVNNIRITDESNVEPPTEKDIEMFESWVKNPHEFRKKLLSSVAPHIYGMMDIKDACSLTLFSDWNWNHDPKDGIERSSIHILLFGDPAIAKSQVIKDVVYIAPKGKFCDVTQMSRGGLSNVAIQENGKWFIKSGFFSQADQGIAGVDEITRVKNPDDLDCFSSVLNEQMQRVSKAGMNDIPFNTRTAILGSANPKGGHLRMSEDIVPQLQDAFSKKDYLLSRFDLIFAIPDIPDKEKDTIVVRTVNKRYQKKMTTRKAIERDIPLDLLRKYILYARTKPLPEIEPGAHKHIEEYYLRLRQHSHENPIIGARQIDDLNRISIAVARRELASRVTEEHARYAIDIMKASQSTMNMNGEDYGLYNSGRTRSQAEKANSIRNAVKEICKKKSSAEIDDIVVVSGLDSIQVEHTIILMEANKEVYYAAGGYRLP